MSTLLGLFGPKRGLRLDVTAPLLVGRSPAAGLQLLDGTVSREHCRFEPVPDGLMLVDLGSQNGTFVNGEPVRGTRALRPGDEVAIGDTLWVFEPDLDLAAGTWGDVFLLATPSLPTQAQAILAEPGEAHPVDLGAVAREVAALPDAEARAGRILDAAIGIIGEGGAMLVRADARGGLKPIAGRAPDGVFALSPEAARLAVERGAAIAADQARPAALRDGRTLTGGVDAVLVAPVMHGRSAHGFLCAGAGGRRRFSPAQAKAMEALAALADLAGLFHAAGPMEAPAPDGGDDPVAASEAFRGIVAQARRLALVPTTVLIVGESGTGKEAIARLLHRAGPRAGGPFIAVNCGAIPEGLAESEWFGSDRGAFTGASRSRPGFFEAADGGTLFLDEIGELPAALQAKLLRVIEERAVFRVGSTTLRRVDVRIVAATHRDLDADARAGRFRQDLLYRLDVARLRLPPLRERRDDVGPLAIALLDRVARRIGLPAPPLDEGAVRALQRHAWPGNARELANVLERVLVLRERGAGPITAREIAAALPGAIADAPVGDTLVEKVAALERAEIEAALRRARGVKARAAEALGISRPTLDKKIADLGVDLFKEGP